MVKVKVSHLYKVSLFSTIFVIIDQSVDICDQGNKPKHVILPNFKINQENVGLLRRSEKRKAHYWMWNPWSKKRKRRRRRVAMSGKVRWKLVKWKVQVQPVQGRNPAF